MTENINLTNRSITAVVWGTIGSGARIILQLVVQVFVVRLLGPEQYGLFAIGVIVVSFSAFFSDIGIAYGLIQKKTVNDEDIRFIFTWQLILGLIVAATVFLLAESVAIFFKEPRVVSIIKILAAVCFINAITAPSLNILKRNLDFKTIHLSQVLSYACGYIFVGIPLALVGQKAWSLVAAWTVQASVNYVVLYRRTQHPLRLLFWHVDAGSLSSYGMKVFATNIVNWLTNNIDRVVVGRMFVTTGVGLYSTSYNLVNTPTTTIIGVLQSSLFSASSRIQDDVVRRRTAFLTVTSALALVIAPIFVGIAVSSETVIRILYGQAWLQAAAILRPLALAMPLYLLIGMATPMLWTAGQTTKEFKIQLIMAAIWITASYYAAQKSISTVAWVVLGLYLVRAAMIIKATISALRIGLGEFAVTIKGGVIMSVVVAMVLALIDPAIRELSTVPIVWLFSDMVLATIAAIVTVKLFPALIVPAVARLIEQVSAPLPPRMAKWVLGIVGAPTR